MSSGSESDSNSWDNQENNFSNSTHTIYLARNPRVRRNPGAHLTSSSILSEATILTLTSLSSQLLFYNPELRLPICESILFLHSLSSLAIQSLLASLPMSGHLSQKWEMPLTISFLSLYVSTRVLVVFCSVSLRQRFSSPFLSVTTGYHCRDLHYFELQ